MFGIRSLVLLRTSINEVIQIRSIYKVRHNAKRGTFYVPLKNEESAVLLYKTDGKILDMKSINVPRDYQGRGLARLLAEAAITYAIVYDYYMILSCEYMQKFYRLTKSPELEERVVGPKHFLESLDINSDPQSIYDLPDPDDSKTSS